MPVIALVFAVIIRTTTNAYSATPLTTAAKLFTKPTRSTARSFSLIRRYSKSSDRAYIERTLEDMMGDDWREFRAKLVAQEQAATASMAILSANETANAASTTTDSKLIKQGQLGDLFAGAISSIFHTSNNSVKKSKSMDIHHSIFDGDCIGGIVDADGYTCNDPFASQNEIPALMQSTIKIDKHRWAHHIPHPEPGSVLIANEKLGGIFHQTVVLIIQHCDKAGSTGVVINRYDFNFFPCSTLLVVFEGLRLISFIFCSPLFIYAPMTIDPSTAICLKLLPDNHQS
jgi:putative transcriptional regulator